MHNTKRLHRRRCMSDRRLPPMHTLVLSAYRFHAQHRAIASLALNERLSLAPMHTLVLSAYRFHAEDRAIASLALNERLSLDPMHTLVLSAYRFHAQYRAIASLAMNERLSLAPMHTLVLSAYRLHAQHRAIASLARNIAHAFLQFLLAQIVLRALFAQTHLLLHVQSLFISCWNVWFFAARLSNCSFSIHT